MAIATIGNNDLYYNDCIAHHSKELISIVNSPITLKTHLVLLTKYPVLFLCVDDPCNDVEGGFLTRWNDRLLVVLFLYRETIS
jgi:hypothetical protein